MEDHLLSTKQAAEFLGVSEAFLERDRWAGAKIPFVRVGTRTVRYERGALENYIGSQVRRDTSDTKAPVRPHRAHEQRVSSGATLGKHASEEGVSPFDPLGPLGTLFGKKK